MPPVLIPKGKVITDVSDVAKVWLLCKCGQYTENGFQCVYCGALPDKQKNFKVMNGGLEKYMGGIDDMPENRKLKGLCQYCGDDLWDPSSNPTDTEREKAIIDHLPHCATFLEDDNVKEEDGVAIKKTSEEGQKKKRKSRKDSEHPMEDCLHDMSSDWAKLEKHLTQLGEGLMWMISAYRTAQKQMKEAKEKEESSARTTDPGLRPETSLYIKTFNKPNQSTSVDESNNQEKDSEEPGSVQRKWPFPIEYHTATLDDVSWKTILESLAASANEGYPEEASSVLGDVYTLLKGMGFDMKDVGMETGGLNIKSFLGEGEDQNDE